MNVAIIGTGFISEVHARSVLAAGHRLMVVCGASAEHAAAFARTWDIPESYTDYRQIPLENIDCVHVCTPPVSHFAICRYFIEQRIPVICEKPLTLNADEAEQLSALVASNGTFFGVCFNNRYYPAVTEIQKILKSGRLGQPVLIYGSYEQEFHIPPVPFSWRFDAAGGNDLRAVSEIGSHMIDLVQFLCEKQVERLCASFGNRQDTLHRDDRGWLLEDANIGTREFPVKNEDTAVIQLMLEGGANVSLALSEVSSGEMNHLRLVIICQRGRISWDNGKADELLVSDEKGSTRIIETGMQTGFQDTCQKMIFDFYQSLSGGKESSITTVTEAMENVRICRKIYESAVGKGEALTPVQLCSEEKENDTEKKRRRKELLIRHYKMELLPLEHTLFSECYHSPVVNQDGKMQVSTMFGLYSQEPESFSRFHRLCHEEIWTFLEGDPLRLYLLYENGTVQTVTLGSDILQGQLLQFTVPENVIQGACLSSGGEYALYSCTVVPGFTTDCFSLPEEEELLKKYPENMDIIRRLCRD